MASQAFARTQSHSLRTVFFFYLRFVENLFAWHKVTTTRILYIEDLDVDVDVVVILSNAMLSYYKRFEIVTAAATG